MCEKGVDLLIGRPAELVLVIAYVRENVLIGKLVELAIRFSIMYVREKLLIC